MIRLKKAFNGKTITVALLVLLIAVPPFINNNYFMHILISICLYTILTISLNLVTGFAGQLSLGNVAFYGIGAYCSALLMLNFGINFWLATAISACMTGLFGFLIGLPTLRLRGDYLAIVTLGFAEIIRLILVNWAKVTRGPMGLPGIPSPELFGYAFSSNKSYYYLILVVVVFTIFFMWRLTNSGMGLAMLTVKNDEIAARSIGINPIKYKLTAFVISAFFAGIAGSFYASYISFISPDTFVYNDSCTILAMVVLGGLGSVPGSIIGATVLTLIPELLRFMSDYRMLIYGLIMVVMMIFRPSGFWGANKRVLNIYKKNAGGSTHG